MTTKPQALDLIGGQPNKNSHRRDVGQQHLKSTNYFGAALGHRVLR
jgi:hypothetical protein